MSSTLRVDDYSDYLEDEIANAVNHINELDVVENWNAFVMEVNELHRLVVLNDFMRSY